MVESSQVPLVSVGIPAYNRPEGLRRTLNCISRQTYRNLEIVVSDNCSTNPEVAAVAREFQQNDPRIVYVRQSHNIGLEANFKFLLQRARSEYFFWAADDDEWALDFVEVALAHLGAAGSVMTGMRNAVRPRGLLRWKPPLYLSTRRRPFDNAVAFFTNLQPSLFYGIHRTDTLRIALRERIFDYYDCFFILRQILTHGFEIAPQVCFHVGIDSEEPTFKPARPRSGAVYEYWPFLSRSLAIVANSSRLALREKIRLWFLLCYVGVNEFTHFERGARPFQVKALSVVKWLMRSLAPWIHMPLPAPPAAMALPDDPAELCSMFIPHAQLQSVEVLQKAIGDAQGELRAKLAVIENCARARTQQPSRRGILGCWRRPAPPARPDANTADAECAAILNAPTDQSLNGLRMRLGRLLLQLERKEATIQALAAKRDSLRRRAA